MTCRDELALDHARQQRLKKINTQNIPHDPMCANKSLSFCLFFKAAQKTDYSDNLSISLSSSNKHSLEHGCQRSSKLLHSLWLDAFRNAHQQETILQTCNTHHLATQAPAKQSAGDVVLGQHWEKYTIHVRDTNCVKIQHAGVLKVEVNFPMLPLNVNLLE